MSSNMRRGFSLIEVLLASALLLGAVVVLGELAHLGIRNSAKARDLTTAEFLCRSTMNEVISQIIPADKVEDTPLASTPGWNYSVDFLPLEQPGLAALRVTVTEDLPEGKKPITFSLVRWVPADLQEDRLGASEPGRGATRPPDRGTLDERHHEHAP
jgi:prepilin-type N-terminal cleavage/methylation domain-containing protein